jgi:hypothetical protein
MKLSKIFTLTIIALALIFFAIWLFNHINPWLGLLFLIIIIFLSLKKFDL